MNIFQPSFKLKEKRREGAKVIKRYHAPAAPYERALQHPKVPRTIKQRLRAQYRTLDPVILLSETHHVMREGARGVWLARPYRTPLRTCDPKLSDECGPSHRQTT